MSAPTSPRDGPSAAPESHDSESGLHDGSKPGRYTDLSKGEAQTAQGTPSAVKQLIGLLSSTKDGAARKRMSDVIRNPSPVQKRLIEQLLVTFDEDAALSKRDGVGAKFDELDGEAETLADGDLGHESAAEHEKSERAASISNFATRITPQTGQRHNLYGEKRVSDDEPAHTREERDRMGMMEKRGDDAAQAQRRAHVERVRNIAVENRKKDEHAANMMRWREEARIQAESELAKIAAEGERRVSNERIADVEQYNEVFHDVAPLQPSETAAWSDQRFRCTSDSRRVTKTPAWWSSASGIYTDPAQDRGCTPSTWTGCCCPWASSEAGRTAACIFDRRMEWYWGRTSTTTW